MSKEGDRASVLRTTTVRTKLRGDGSWLQPQDKPVAETLEEEKPWLDEVRARRLNGAPIETSPVSSPVETTPPPVKTDTESKPATQGFLIRGVFTKLENPVSSPSYNDNIKPKTFNKKPSEKYKQIAPHTVRNTSENAEGLLSPEEQEKRKEAAISVMKQKAARRSYVLSAAKRYEAKDTPPDSAVTSSSASFVAKRVEIVDEDESGVKPEPATAVTPSPAVLPTSTPPAPAPTPGPAVNATEKITDKLVVCEPVSLKATKVTPDAPKAEPLSQSGTKKEESEDEKTKSNDVTVAEEPQPEAETPLVKLLPAVETSPVQKSVSSGSYALAPVAELMVKTTPEPQSEPDADHKAEPEPEPEPIPKQLKSKPSAEPSSNMYTLAALSDTLLSFNTHPCSAENGDQELATEEGGLVDSPTPEDSVEQEPVPELRDGEPITGDLLGFSDGPEELAEPVPSSPGLWSQDLLGGLGSESNPAKTSDTLDVRANDVVPVNKEARSLSMQQQQQHVEEKQTDETAMETQSQEDNADPWSSQQTTSDDEERSAEPFDPYPICTVTHISSTDLYTPSKIWKEPTVFGIQYASGEEDVEDEEDEVEMDIQNDPEPATDDSEQPLMTTWETPQQTNTEESREATTEDKSEDQQTVIMFERKSTENESPWNRWTTPTVYILSTASGEEDVEDEDEEEMLENTSVAVVDDVRRDPSPEPEIKKPFVYVKEYIDTSEMSLLNTWDTPDGSDGLASSSISYSYSSPYSNTRASLSSTCTSCGEHLGEGAKITMEHLNINCHLECFKCDVCSRPMGDILDSMSLHNKKVHCESCRSTVI